MSDEQPTQPEPDAAAAAAQRQCARVACAAEAVATLTADYENREMAVGPLSPEPVFQTHDLCRTHSERLTPPSGWTIMRHESS